MTAPASLDVELLHELRYPRKMTARSMAIVRTQPRLEPAESVDLFICAAIGVGMMDLHFVLTRNQAGELIDMLQEALHMVGGRDQ